LKYNDRSLTFNDYPQLWDPLTIVDPIYGALRFSREISRIINTADFQRLRGIKQLSLVSLQYPSADHSRFIHSLGVAHLIRLAIDYLKLNAQRFKEEIEIKFEEKDELETILAGLLHDIGHGPTGHVLDTFFFRENVPHKHEDYTQKRIIDSPYDLTATIEKIGLEPKIIAAKAIGRKIDNNAFYSNLIANYGMDMDRLDYIARDSYFTGVGLKDFNYFLLLSDAIIVPGYKIDSPKIDKEQYYLAFNESSLQQSIEPLLLARAMLYGQVYYSSKNRGPQLMLVKAIEQMVEKGEIVIDEIMEKTDGELWSIILSTKDNLARNLIARIKFHRLYTLLVEFNRTEDVTVRLLDLVRKGETNKIKDIERKATDELINAGLLRSEDVVLIDIPTEKGIGTLFIAKTEQNKILEAYSIERTRRDKMLISAIDEQMKSQNRIRIYGPPELKKEKLIVEWKLKELINNYC